MVIAISGKSGCGNSSVSRALAQKYGYTLINYTFREYAQEHGLRFDEIHALAKKGQEIDRYIDERQVKLAQKGDCVVGSRLAIWKIAHAHLRVYLTAPLFTRAYRISQREKIPYLVILFGTLLRDIKDRIRYRKYYGININNYKFVELIINSKKNSIADIIAAVDERLDARVTKHRSGGNDGEKKK